MTPRLRDSDLFTRREVLRRSLGVGAGLASASLLAACTGTSGTNGAAPSGSPASSQSASASKGDAGQVLVRSAGGTAEDGFRQTFWEPFTKETGIKVVPVAGITLPKMLAMIQTGSVELDLPDPTWHQAIVLERAGGLEKLDRSKLTGVTFDSINLVRDNYIGKSSYAVVLGYNSQALGAKRPGSWADFWNVSAFPGRRMLEDPAADYPNLEQALMADGVAIDKLYPIDIDRAFAKLKQIKPSILKWWNSGAVAAQLLSDKQVEMGSIWETRLIPLMEGGAPLGIEWNQSMRIVQTYSIMKGAPNRDNAHKYIAYGLRPDIQAAISKVIRTGPSNRKAFDYMDKDLASKLNTSPAYAASSFDQNAEWWAANNDKVLARWQEFLLS
jgi:putative spermidine/putrescine transport system substrate-binding protein